MKSSATKKVKPAKKSAKTAASQEAKLAKKAAKSTITAKAKSASHTLKAAAAKKAKPAKGSLKSASARKAKPEKKKLSAKKKTGRTKDSRVKRILAKLKKRYPDAHCALEHNTAFQLLVATILSAQCTDVRVNKVTPGLFEKYPTPTAFASVNQKELEQNIRSTGFFRNKAKNIIGAAKKIVEDFNGEVPQSMDEMLTLPGVARKTANVVLGTWFGKETGVVVDTHVFRISHRLKLSNGKTPEKVEEDLQNVVPEGSWISFAHQVILFGREICHARNPLCVSCPLVRDCDSPDKTV